MEEKNSGVRAVERALTILDCFTPNKSSFTLTELSKQIKLSPSTTLRLLETLVSKNYIYRDPLNLRYHMGYRLAQLSNVAFENCDYCLIAQPELVRLNKLFDESVGIYMLKGTSRVCMARLESSKQMRGVYALGSIQPLTRGASGRILLAFQPQEVIEQLLKEDPFTTFEALADLRRKMYAVSLGEREEGLTSIAAPIFNARGNAVSSIFISSPSMRASFSVMENMIKEVCQSSREISKQMGFIEPD